jgi:FAD/FMN-containing dehydrogenase
LHLDTRPLRRVRAYDHERGVIDVEAGIQWPEVIARYIELQEELEPGREPRWGLAQKQTGADDLCLGGALSANAHGRGLALPPLAADVESFTLVDAQGELRNCSRSEEPQLFALALGGYGLFGVILSVRLRLAPRRKLERVVEIRAAPGLEAAFEQRIRDGFLYGDFQFDLDADSDGFLQRGVFACYRPVDPATPVPEDQAELAPEAWERLIRLAHDDKRAAYELYTGHYLATSGQVYWSDLQQLGYYPAGYHAQLDREHAAIEPGSEMISELYVPRARLADFLEAAAALLRAERASVIYGTVRLIEPDRDSFLAWARERWACCVLNLHVDHGATGLARARRAFCGLIDLAAERDGSYFLTYHRWATRAQVEACHPRMGAFLARKREYDPDERFQSEWYRHHCALLGV